MNRKYLLAMMEYEKLKEQEQPSQQPSQQPQPQPQPQPEQPEQPVKKAKKPYVTREQKDEFIEWYLEKYGYNVNLKINNSRVLSEAYEREKGIYIPKITIFRWLGKLKEEIVESFASEYIDESLTDSTLVEVKEGLQ